MSQVAKICVTHKTQNTNFFQFKTVKLNLSLLDEYEDEDDEKNKSEDSEQEQEGTLGREIHK